MSKDLLPYEGGEGKITKEVFETKFPYLYELFDGYGYLNVNISDRRIFLGCMIDGIFYLRSTYNFDILQKINAYFLEIDKFCIISEEVKVEINKIIQKTKKTSF